MNLYLSGEMIGEW